MAELNELWTTYTEARKKLKGLCNIDPLFSSLPVDHLQKIVKSFPLPISAEITKNQDVSREQILTAILDAALSKYEDDKQIRKKYQDPLTFLGSLLISALKKLKDWEISLVFETLYDFLSKQELINIFADYCADLGITVSDARHIEEHSIDLYLTKRDPFLTTEVTLVLLGVELAEITEVELRTKLNDMQTLADWKLIVTTPYGVMNYGYSALIELMEEYDCWLYVVSHDLEQIIGLTKGKKSKNKDEEEINKIIENLPEQPIRAPSELSKFSKYYFSEKESYKPKNYTTFGMSEQLAADPYEPPALYKDIFRNLVIMDNNIGLSILSVSNEKNPVDQQLVSGFLQAMDSFVSNIGGESSLEEISYKGFKILAAYGKDMKCIIFLSDSAPPPLHERLNRFMASFERIFASAIALFKKKNNVSGFDEKQVELLARSYLGF